MNASTLSVNYVSIWFNLLLGSYSWFRCVLLLCLFIIYCSRSSILWLLGCCCIIDHLVTRLRLPMRVMVIIRRILVISIVIPILVGMISIPLLVLIVILRVIAWVRWIWRRLSTRVYLAWLRMLEWYSVHLRPNKFLFVRFIRTLSSNLCLLWLLELLLLLFYQLLGQLGLFIPNILRCIFHFSSLSIICLRCSL